MFTKKLFKKTTALAFATSVIFTSCKKDDVVTQPQPAKPLQLTTFKSGDDVTRFEYNGDGTINKIFLKEDPVTTDDNVTYTAKYLANKKISEFTGSNGAKIKLSYSNNLLSKSEAFMGAVKISESVFSYTGNQLKTSAISVFYNNSNVGVPFFKSDFTYNAAGNVSRGSVFTLNPLNNQLEPSGYVNNFYDNKINPFASLGDIMLVFWQYASSNNIIKQAYFDKNGVAQEVVETTYIYDAQGYPTSATMKETQPGQQPTTTTIAYTYTQ
jgi:hypothetical protein